MNTTTAVGIRRYEANLEYRPTPRDPYRWAMETIAAFKCWWFADGCPDDLAGPPCPPCLAKELLAENPDVGE